MGLDRFGRVRDQRWLKSDAITAPLDRFEYSYDRTSNRTARSNLATTGLNETYGYDALNQLTSFVRGSHSLNWTLDALGNWSSLSTDGGAAVERSHNRQNQLTGVGSTTTYSFDGNGNTIQERVGEDITQTWQYDAWDRLTQATSGGTTVNFRYDALNRRIREDYAGTANDRELYSSADWQVLEERLTEASTAKLQYVWSPVYVDALVLRDRDVVGDPVLEERLYVQQDANWNVTALVDAAGGVVERYLYDPYGGGVIVLDGAWGPRGSSQYAWVYLHQGGRYEAVSALYHFRYRDLQPKLGRWVSRDPTEFAARDSNLYRYESNAPVGRIDPAGLKGIFTDFTNALLFGPTGPIKGHMGALPSVGLGLSAQAGIMGGLFGFQAGGLGAQIMYYPSTGDIALFIVPTLPGPATGLGLGPWAGANLGPVVSNAQAPDEYTGFFLEAEGSVLVPTKFGGIGVFGNYGVSPGGPIWAASGGLSYGTPGVTVTAPQLSYYWNPVTINIDTIGYSLAAAGRGLLTGIESVYKGFQSITNQVLSWTLSVFG